MRKKELRDLGLQQVIELQMIPYNVERYISSDFGLVLSVKGMSDITEKIFCSRTALQADRRMHCVYAFGLCACTHESDRGKA